jgi:transcriptional regulator with XRE-family HTH domain
VTKKEILEALGIRISKERKKRGITLEKLAYEMGLSKGNLSDIEHGKRDPRFSTLKAISKGLGISTSTLLKEL